MGEKAIGLQDIHAAMRRISGQVRRTPLERSDSLSALGLGEIWLKCEHHQITGSFKLRGATNALAALSAAERARGVAAVSSGNHGRGLAYAAAASGTPCIVCMSRLVPANKVEAIRALGAEIRIVGDSQDAAIRSAGHCGGRSWAGSAPARQALLSCDPCGDG